MLKKMVDAFKKIISNSYLSENIFLIQFSVDKKKKLLDLLLVLTVEHFLWYWSWVSVTEPHWW